MTKFNNGTIIRTKIGGMRIAIRETIRLDRVRVYGKYDSSRVILCGNCKKFWRYSE